MREPFRYMNGSGRNALLGRDAKLGIGGTVQVVPPLPACDTVTVCEGIPLADTVTVAVRAALAVFACAVAVTAALLDPDAGFTLSQAWSSLTVQLVFDVTLNVPL